MQIQPYDTAQLDAVIHLSLRGTALTEFALDWMKSAGMSIAMVETGGDPGHAPARHTYEKVGFKMFSVARYFKKL